MKVSDIAFGFKRYALHERGMRPRSYQSIMASVAMLCDWADTDDISRLDHGTVKAFLYWGREERAWEARTFRNHRQYLKSYFTWCLGQAIIKQNPVEGIDKPKLPQRLPRCLNREDTQTVLAYPRWHSWRYRIEAIRNETILYLLVYTGMRLQEMLNLETGDVDLRAGAILVRQGKGQKDRSVPIHPRLLPILRSYLHRRRELGVRSSSFFSGAQSNKPLRDKDVWRICKAVSRGTGVYFTPHMLRHTFGRLMVEADVDLFKIKEIMGHSSVTTTQIYLSVSTENLKKTFDEIALL
ncbi:MAG: tyrosine-type recombinase/integrase [Pseudomonadota bacterium]